MTRADQAIPDGVLEGKSIERKYVDGRSYYKPRPQPVVLVVLSLTPRGGVPVGSVHRGGARSQQRAPFRVDGQEVRFFTPVRRSVRIERASLGYPAYLREQDACVASYDELLAEDQPEGGAERHGASGGDAPATPMYVYRENEALKDQVKVQLVYDDEDDE